MKYEQLLHRKVTLKDVIAFLQGNIRYYLRAFLPEHIKEQISFRESICLQCLKAKSCLSCGCHVPQKFYASDQCGAKAWPELMGRKEWESYKMNNGFRSL